MFGGAYMSRIAQLVERTHLITSAFILGEVGGSSPSAGATPERKGLPKAGESS